MGISESGQYERDTGVSLLLDAVTGMPLTQLHLQTLNGHRKWESGMMKNFKARLKLCLVASNVQYSYLLTEKACGWSRVARLPGQGSRRVQRSRLR